MASKTFMVRLQAIDGEASVEQPVTSLAGHPYLEHCAVLGVFNQAGSGVTATIEEVFISPVGMKADLVAAREIHKITAASGEEKLLYIKMDTNNNNLPSQIDILYRPTGVTGGSTFKKDIFMPTINNARATFYQQGRFTGFSKMGLNNSISCTQGMWDKQSSATQSVVLNEGQGIALYNPAGSALNTHFVEMLFRVVGTGQEYMVVWDLPQNAAYEYCFAMMNNTGSGVVLEILSIQHMEQGEDLVPMFTVEPIDGMGLSVGEEVTPISFDSLDTCPVTTRQNCLVYSKGYKAGAIMVINYMRKFNSICQYGTTPNSVGSIFNFQQARMYNKAMTFLRNIAGIDSVVLHEGQGLAVFNRTSNAIGNVDVSIKFRTEAVATGGGGGGMSAGRRLGGF